MSRVLTGVAVTVSLHVMAGAALLQLEPACPAISPAVPIRVSLISPAVKPPEPTVLPKPLPIAPRVQRSKHVQRQPLIAALNDAPSTAIVPADVPAPVNPPEVAAPEPMPAPAVMAAPMPTAAPVSPPSFSADYLRNPAPVYPPLSRRMGEEGQVILRVFVDVEGSPAQVQVKTSSGHARLDDAASQTVRQWRFVPARRGDQPTAAWVLVPISFSFRS